VLALQVLTTPWNIPASPSNAEFAQIIQSINMQAPQYRYQQCTVIEWLNFGSSSAQDSHAPSKMPLCMAGLLLQRAMTSFRLTMAC
jgi:hypothetical protein